MAPVPFGITSSGGLHVTRTVSTVTHRFAIPSPPRRKKSHHR